MDIRAQKRVLRRAMVERILALDPARRARPGGRAGRSVPGLAGFEEAADRPALRVGLPRGDRHRAHAPRRPWSGARRCSAPGSIAPRGGSGSTEVDDPEHDLAPGTLGIPEPRAVCLEIAPDDVDWVLVPGLAFDDRGFRLGRGAGHYDRLLPTLRPDAPRWALAFDCQWVEAFPVEPHDVPARRDRLAPHWGDSPGDHEGSSGGGSRRAPTAGLITELGPRASGAWRTPGRRPGRSAEAVSPCGG